MNHEDFEKYISQNNLMNGVKGARYRATGNVTVPAEQVREIWQSLCAHLMNDKKIDNYSGFVKDLNDIQNLIVKKH